MLEHWTDGYRQSELDAAQEKFGIQFPPDLLALLLEKRPRAGHDWRSESEIRRALAWPFEALRFDIEYNGLWWPEWGQRHEDPEIRAEALQTILDAAPRLIPIMGHRYLPESPHEAGNPVFSVYGADTIVYGANLEAYFRREFATSPQSLATSSAKTIPFWSRLAEQNH
jgi:hypothetical protein